MKYYRTCLCISLCITFLSTAVAQIIPSSRSVNWRSAGTSVADSDYLKTISITSMQGVGDGATPNDAALANAIAALKGKGGVIYFPAGTYLFELPVTLPNGVVLRGQGATSTMLKFNLDGRENLVTIAGAPTATLIPVTSPVQKGSNVVVVGSTTGLSVGDYVKLFQEDTTLIRSSWALGCVGQLLQIESINGNAIAFQSAIRRSYPLSEKPQIRKYHMATGTGIEYLKIKRLDATLAQTSNVLFENAANCWVKGVESDSCNFAHVQISNSTHVSVTGSYFHGSFGYGGGGQGYGVSCEYTSGECLIENNIFKHLRHSMLVQSGANGNVFAYNYSILPYKSEAFPNDFSGDIVLHGNYPYANLFEGNVVQNIIIDASHYINGPFNTLFRNRAESYGLIMSSGSGDSTNIVGNEVSSNSFGKGNYMLTGVGNFEYGNNRKGTIIPAGTNILNDKSYYYDTTPAFWKTVATWPVTGVPNPINNSGNPAKTRYIADTVLTYTNPYLSLLSITHTPVAAGFMCQVYNYSAIVPANINSVLLIVTTYDPAATTRLNGSIVQGGGQVVSLQPGINDLVITVLAKDGITTTTYTCQVTRIKPAITFAGKVFLQGAYNTESSKMTNVLNATGVLAANALHQPYSGAPFYYSAADSVLPSIFTSHPQIVDWLLIELRSAANPALMIAKRAALLHQDGTILGLDGESGSISFPGVDTGNYYVAIRHRNHLGIRSANPLRFADTATYDFTTGADQCFQNRSYTATVQVGSIWVMRGGNANYDVASKYSGPLNDQNQIFNIRLRNSYSTVLSNVYAAEDINMDGTIRWSGVNNDQSFLLNTVLNGSIGTVYQEQL